jgi:hypothetical protein
MSGVSTRDRRPGLPALALTLVAGLCVAPSTPAQEADPREERIEELERRIQQLEEQLEAAEDQETAEAPADGSPAADAGDPTLAELERRLEILAAELERQRLGEAAVAAGEGEHGMGPAASKIYRTGEGLSIGGYGEMLYQAPDSTRDDGTPSGRGDELDFLRAVLYFGYKFNDRWLFNSEIELEHASTDQEGSASVEFAYVDWLARPAASARFGLVLVPMGFVNELHEPPIFLGARRPDLEQLIIPSTWRENGVGLFGDVGPFAYRTYLVNGLDASGFSARGLRGGRQKGSQAKAEDFAWVGRLDWVDTPGLLAGVSLYRGGSGQGLSDPAGRVIEATTTLWEGHVEWTKRGFELRGLAVQGEVDDVARLNAALGLEGEASVGEELEGWYLQAGYDLAVPFAGLRGSLVPYLRLESYDTQAAVPSGFAANPANDVESWTLGLAYQPIDQVVFKADFQDYDNEAGTGVDQVNVAVGYLF